MKSLDDMTQAELLAGRATAVAELERLEAEKVEWEKDREERAIQFTKQYIESNVDSECKSLLLELSGDLARKLITLFDNVQAKKS